MGAKFLANLIGCVQILRAV